MSWLTNSCQLVISWLGILASCGGAHYPAIFHIRVSLLVGRLVWNGVLVRISRRLRQYYHAASTQRGRSLQFMAYQPIAIDCAGADDGRAEGAGSTEPGLSTDQGSVRASVEHSLMGHVPIQRIP